MGTKNSNRGSQTFCPHAQIIPWQKATRNIPCTWGSWGVGEQVLSGMRTAWGDTGLGWAYSQGPGHPRNFHRQLLLVAGFLLWAGNSVHPPAPVPARSCPQTQEMKSAGEPCRLLASCVLDHELQLTSYIEQLKSINQEGFRDRDR